MENLTMWFDDFDNVLILARHMVAEGFITTPEELIYFFEKPWTCEPDWLSLSVTL